MNPFRWEDYIEEHPEVMVGKPVFKGTRLTVELIVNALEAGATHEELLEDFPTLKCEHVWAAKLYNIKS